MTKEPTHVLEKIKDSVSRSNDVQAGLAEHCSGLLDCIANHPMDCGVRKIRAITLCHPSKGNEGSFPGEDGWLVIVRAISENGDDVVSYTAAGDLNAAFADYVFHATTKSIEWKPDDKSKRGGQKGSFIDLIAGTQAK